MNTNMNINIYANESMNINTYIINMQTQSSRYFLTPRVRYFISLKCCYAELFVSGNLCLHEVFSKRVSKVLSVLLRCFIFITFCCP